MAGGAGKGGPGGGGPGKGGSGGGGSGRGGKPKGSSGRGERSLHVRVKTAKGRRLSSTRWLQRQLNDPYVQRAQKDGYRGRAAYKLIELDDKLRVLRPGARVVDLGCAPGGWCQVAVARVNALGEKSGRPVGRVIGLDIQAVEPIPGATLIEADFLEEGAEAALLAALDGPADAVLSDMAAAATGHKATDHIKIMALAEAAAEFAMQVLAPGGVFLAKVLQGGTENQLLAQLKRRFAKVAHVKPPASRADSSEMYVVASGFRPAEAPGDDG
ncbi:RlmE family RNA methyltransferase [Paralimibaculum aggregatum]|uniref:Ribosomal RNA large subunit methyltransferase E n=1 Tax=Paralimibaculum aggregatum TaxID=3036245 RepID=A0ABQ6LM15_9RHOB|nr:RlmE family RNA methyltransferase [Limibaculum sp. NKW23]GMG82732.1 RlmE family RNA methyltransferase [Limibaculum sp. NKW23]